ncbi:MAG: CSLREA domain-containing protein [Chloroflexi bacterium]|nr:CSLREA domain-containing protein [Chloroflexota bacterium]
MAVGLEKSGRWVLWVPLVAAVLVLGVLAGTHPASADTAYTVNTAADAVDATIGDGLCLTAAGKCSLRAAIQEANANPDLTVITLKEKTHKITILGTDEDARRDRRLRSQLPDHHSGRHRRNLHRRRQFHRPRL